MQPAVSPPKPQEIGAVLDDFTLTSVQTGQPVQLSAVMAGKKGAVVMFWSGICSHCVRYDGYVNGFARHHPDIGLVAVASRHGEVPEMIRGAIAERSLEFPILHDPGGATARAWYTQQTPRVFLLDAERRLLYRGAIDNFKYPEDPQYDGYLEPAIAAFSAGNPVPRTETASFGCAITSVYYILPKAL